MKWPSETGWRSCAAPAGGSRAGEVAMVRGITTVHSPNGPNVTDE